MLNKFLKHIFYFRHVIFVFAIIDLLKENKKLIYLFCKAFVITIFIVAIDGVIQFFFNFNSLDLKKLDPIVLLVFLVIK